MGDVGSQNERTLHERAVERIDQQQLPREKPSRMWGGRGTGQACALCDSPILESEPEMELEYEPPAPLQNIRLHLRCQSIWDAARHEQRTSQWISMQRELPPLHTLVEARISLGEARSLILNVMRVCDGETGPVVWLNATTNAQLPDAWRPVEWRPVAAPESPSLPRTFSRRA